jgi:hypothetical protein
MAPQPRQTGRIVRPQPQNGRKRCPAALVPAPIRNVLDVSVSGGFELSLWTTLMMTRRLVSGVLRF